MLAKKILFKLSVQVEVSSVESNETTAATVSCDLAPPPQRRRRRHPPLAPPPRNLPFVTLPHQQLHNRSEDAENAGRASDRRDSGGQAVPD